MRRSQERFEQVVNLYASARGNLFGFVWELDIGSRFGFADDLNQLGGNRFQSSAVIAIVGNQGNLRFRNV
jgi:hypothetical protein